MKLNLGILVVAPLAVAKSQGNRQGRGLVGYGISLFDPICAYTCHGLISHYRLECSVIGYHGGRGERRDGRGGRGFMTSDDCYAADDSFLRSVAYCISTHCPDDSTSSLEDYWSNFLIGREAGGTIPKEPYSVALLHANPPPEVVVDLRSLLNETTLVDERRYSSTYNAYLSFQQMEIRQNEFGLILLIMGAAIPIACSLLRFVPFPKIVTSKFRVYLIDPPLFGHRHRQPFYDLALVPTRGQALLIGYFLTINVVLSCVDYRLVPVDPGSEGDRDQVLSYITNRQGVLSFANLALLIIYSGRNNLLLHVTDWSYSTFLLLHRWIAIICTVEACIHSAIYLQVAIVRESHDIESKRTYWIWGIVATLAMSILLPASALPIRRKIYNFFITFHFAFAFIVLISCYFHVYYRYFNQWGYETWLYIAFGFWAFDRLMRLVRLARNGIKRAEIAAVDEEYIRVDIPGIIAQGHAYLYFPTLTWFVWENHPFSVIGTLMAEEPQRTPSTMTTNENIRISPKDLEKAPHSSDITPVGLGEPIILKCTDLWFKPGLTFFVRTGRKGLTAALRKKESLPVLVEASYAALPLEELRTIPNCVLIAGGVGISAVASVLRARGTGRIRLFWGARSKLLVEAVRVVLGSDVLVPGVVGDIAVGRRLDLRAILEREVVENSETAVVVCGPNSMADEVRSIVTELAKRGRMVKLVDEAFSW